MSDSKIFIAIFFFITNSNAQDENSKYFSKDEGVLSIMYHRFNEFKYPSTNISMDIFKEHIELIKKSGIQFYHPKKFEKEFEIPKKNKMFRGNIFIFSPRNKIFYFFFVSQSVPKWWYKAGFGTKSKIFYVKYFTFLCFFLV